MWTPDIKPTSDIEFITTQALDFLMTEDDDYIISQDSHFWANELKPIN